MGGATVEGYDFRSVEARWQETWEREGLHHADLARTERKLYVLVMFIYPSGDKLHIGHWYNYAPTDTWARYRRMRGYTVFEPMGYDAFGLPAENYAVKTGIHPAISTRENVAFIRRQLLAMGAMWDWDRELDTSHPEYYRWTQWLFLTLYRNDLAYRREAPVNWCPGCKTVLANEQVVEGGKCERCGTEVTRRDLTQWFFRITRYADRLLEGLDRIDWPERTRTMQRNWIGRSEGAEILFPIPARSHAQGREERLAVFTTRPDTLFGATYVVLAPEHPLVPVLTSPSRRAEVEDYRERARRATEIERTSLVREKTGVPLGASAVNPATGEEIPIWISDYILLSYGTGAIMAVPGHDERDFAFARTLGLPIRKVILAPGTRPEEPLKEAYTGEGTLLASGVFTGSDWREGARRIVAWLSERGLGRAQVQYKLRDWLVSRQRYWGAPIPIVHCRSCGEVPVPEEDLPVLLPEQVDFRPRGDGLSPLATAPEFVRTRCPRCREEARRDTDTMDTFVDSSWYFLRFLSPRDDRRPFDPDLAARWCPVDQYVGGAEHAVMHLLYARFVTKALYDLGLLPFDEPFTRLIHQGTITNRGAKMSKSRGNVVNPEKFLSQYGADTLRMYLMFMGDYTEGGDWDDTGIGGIHRFLQRVWRLYEGQGAVLERKGQGGEIAGPGEGASAASGELWRRIHQTSKAVTEDLERFHFNTAISRLMECVNECYRYIGDHTPPQDRDPRLLAWALRTLNRLLAPFAPHLAEELWRGLQQRSDPLILESWPSFDPGALLTEEVAIAIQVNGRLRAEILVPRGASAQALERRALAHEKVQRALSGRHPRKVIVVPNRLVNLVV